MKRDGSMFVTKVIAITGLLMLVFMAYAVATKKECLRGHYETRSSGGYMNMISDGNNGFIPMWVPESEYETYVCDKFKE